MFWGARDAIRWIFLLLCLVTSRMETDDSQAQFCSSGGPCEVNQPPSYSSGSSFSSESVDLPLEGCRGRACTCGLAVSRIENTNLWIGDLRSARNTSLLRDMGISRVVSVLAEHEEYGQDWLALQSLEELVLELEEEAANGESVVWDEDTGDLNNEHSVRYHRIAVLDDGLHKLAPHMEALTQALECTEAEGESFANTSLVPAGAFRTCSALIHCVEGVSRSPTFIMAYLITARGWTLRQALDSLRAARPCIQPRFQWFDELLELERNVSGGLNSVTHADNYQPIALAPPSATQLT
eukprot:gb/GEZN01008519.1/.p1 GENE.gb/GEZN01008519.1/~~gb/GEZN01008519.1/.p1  ORF type:complete len:296 (-),score=23.23 gb/GEZN01008519.1/:405-1292(-)